MSIILSLCAVPIAAAQSVAPLPSRPVTVADPANVVALPPDQQLALLEQWTHDYQQWRAWYLEWQNRPEPGWFSSRARREPPVPPEWLPWVCAAATQDAGPLFDACAAWREWRAHDMAAALMTQQIAQTRADVEAPVKTKWWERVHVDALWPMTRAGSSAFGVAGVHTTMHVTKRFQVFLTPGFILMRAPAINGTPTWSAAADWGFSYGLFDMRVPVVGRPGTVHLNIARVWVFGTEGMPSTGEVYLAGFSLSFKQR